MAENPNIIHPLLPLRDIVLFPGMVVPLVVGREKSVLALERAMQDETLIFLVAQREATIEEPTQKDLFTMGTLGKVMQLLRLPEGTVKALVEGKQRARLVGVFDALASEHSCPYARCFFVQPRPTMPICQFH
jgi:ATP-dependent Lon protease